MTPRFTFVDTPLAGLCLVQRSVRSDDRGWFEPMYSEAELESLLGHRAIIQVNRSLTHATATVRGMHFQVQPSAEAKVVSCLRGSVFDVAVDLRKDSPTLLQWHGEVLSQENRRSVFIPEGFAHGFQAMVDSCELLYLHTAPYDPAAERVINPLDPRVGISWPLPVGIVSERDSSQPPLGSDFLGIES